MADDETTPPKCRGYDLAAVLALRDELVNEVAFGYEYTTLAGADLASFVGALQRRLARNGARAEAVADSCLGLAGKELTPAALHALAWRLAGNLRRLRDGLPVFPWSAQAAPEWMPLAAAVVEPGRDKYDRPGAWIRFQVLAGSACPAQVRRFWTADQCRFFARELGYTGGPRVRRPISYRHPVDLAGLRLSGLFEPATCRDRPGFRQIACGPSLRAHNLAIIRVRARLDPCPRGWSHPCSACALGYASPPGETCPAATHPTQWYAGHCDDCGQDDRPFDDAVPSTACVTCTRRHRSARRKKED